MDENEELKNGSDNGSGSEMGENEFKEFVDKLKSQGLTDEDILDVMYKAFTDGEISREDLESAANSMGYKAKEEFMNEKEPDPKDGGGSEGEITDDQIEAAKEAKPGESEEEFKERVAEGKSADEDSDEDEEKKEAMSLFGND